MQALSMIYLIRFRFQKEKKLCLPLSNIAIDFSFTSAESLWMKCNTQVHDRWQCNILEFLQFYLIRGGIAFFSSNYVLFKRTFEAVTFFKTWISVRNLNIHPSSTDMFCEHEMKVAIIQTYRLLNRRFHRFTVNVYLHVQKSTILIVPKKCCLCVR